MTMPKGGFPAAGTTMMFKGNKQRANMVKNLRLTLPVQTDNQLIGRQTGDIDSIA